MWDLILLVIVVFVAAPLGVAIWDEWRWLSADRMITRKKGARK